MVRHEAAEALGSIAGTAVLLQNLTFWTFLVNMSFLSIDVLHLQLFSCFYFPFLVPISLVILRKILHFMPLFNIVEKSLNGLHVISNVENLMKRSDEQNEEIYFFSFFFLEFSFGFFSCQIICSVDSLAYRLLNLDPLVRWQKCWAPEAFRLGSWTHCFPELWSCPKYAGVWESWQILRGNLLWHDSMCWICPL